MMETDTLILEINADQIGNRLDKALALAAGAAGHAGLSRARIQALMAEGHVTDEDGMALSNPSAKIQQPLSVQVTPPPPEDAIPLPQDIPLGIVYEDEHLLVIDKPAGMVVHPAAGAPDGTLVNALLHHCGDRLSGIGGVKRPGIVHRLDKETSGLMVVAKTDLAHQGLSAQFADRSLSRRYMALVWGTINPRNGQIIAAIGRDPHDRKRMAIVESGGKPAVTHYETEQQYGRLVSRITCRLETGRTHQIRVHLASIGHPLLGDPVYGDTRQARRWLRELPPDIAAEIPAGRQALHAYAISFRHPVSGETLEFTAAPPMDIGRLQQHLESWRTKTN